MKRKKIVTIGGGTGTFAVLTGLKDYPVDLTAIVAMSDDGGSTGRLRDEFGVLPPGDVRQSLVALSEDGDVMRELFTHRFEKGEMKGHSFGNIFISTLEQVTGSMDRALEHIGRLLNLRGKVVPVTLSKVKLVVELNNGKVIQGEDAMRSYQLVSKFGIKSMKLEPEAKANPKAIAAIKQADIIVVGPGHLYGSLIPNFLVPGIGDAFARSKAKKVYIANLMNRYGHTDGFTVLDYVNALEDAIGKRGVFDVIVYNTRLPAAALLKMYADEGEPISPDMVAGKDGPTLVGTDLLSRTKVVVSASDPLAWQRALIRHDPKKIAKIVANL